MGAGASHAEPQREVAAQVGARGRGEQAADRQQPTGAVPPGRPGDQRAREQRRRARLGDRVHETHPLLMAVQRRPVREPGGRGGHGGGHPGRDERRGGALGTWPAAQVEQYRGGPAAERDPHEGRMGRLAERHAVQRVGPPAGRQGADHEAREHAYRLVEGLGAFDALGDRGRLDRAEHCPCCPQQLVTGGLPHTRDVPRQTARFTRVGRRVAAAVPVVSKQGSWTPLSSLVYRG